MEQVILRARATCASCASRLPPRSEAWWDDETATATCTTCARTIAAEEAAAGPSDLPTSAVADHAVAGGLPPGPVAPAVAPPAATPPAVARTEPTPSAPAAPAAAPPTATAPAVAPPVVPRDGDAVVEDPPPPPPEPDDDPRHVRAVADLIGRIRTVDASDVGHPHGRTGVVLVERPQAPPAELDRGDMGEGRVGQTLEGARIHGLEVLHGVALAAGVAPVDHLVVAVNGLWVVRAVDVLAGPLERRDLGDWFTADPHLYIAGEDRSDLVRCVADQVAATVGLLAPTRHADLPVRGVVCFGSAPAGWVTTPFGIDDVWVTWRNHLVEPMLEPVLVDPAGRVEIATLLTRDRRVR